MYENIYRESTLELVRFLSDRRVSRFRSQLTESARAVLPNQGREQLDSYTTSSQARYGFLVHDSISYVMGAALHTLIHAVVVSIVETLQCHLHCVKPASFVSRIPTMRPLQTVPSSCQKATY